MIIASHCCSLLYTVVHSARRVLQEVLRQLQEKALRGVRRGGKCCLTVVRQLGGPQTRAGRITGQHSCRLACSLARPRISTITHHLPWQHRSIIIPETEASSWRPYGLDFFSKGKVGGWIKRLKKENYNVVMTAVWASKAECKRMGESRELTEGKKYNGSAWWMAVSRSPLSRSQSRSHPAPAMHAWVRCDAFERSAPHAADSRTVAPRTCQMNQIPKLFDFCRRTCEQSMRNTFFIADNTDKTPGSQPRIVEIPPRCRPVQRLRMSNRSCARMMRFMGRT